MKKSLQKQKPDLNAGKKKVLITLSDHTVTRLKIEALEKGVKYTALIGLILYNHVTYPGGDND